MVDSCGGKFPRSADELRKIPGIGPYTGKGIGEGGEGDTGLAPAYVFPLAAASAVASIAFGEPTAVIDGNVVRVMTRLRSIGLDPKKAPVQRAVAGLAQSLLDPGRPGCFNQAVMELGATVCTPECPNCKQCPVEAQCSASRELRSYLAGGGSLEDSKAPLVTRYPLKAGDICPCLVSAPAPAGGPTRAALCRWRSPSQGKRRWPSVCSSCGGKETRAGRLPWCALAAAPVQRLAACNTRWMAAGADDEAARGWSTCRSVGVPISSDGEPDSSGCGPAAGRGGWQRRGGALRTGASAQAAAGPSRPGRLPARPAVA